MKPVDNHILLTEAQFQALFSKKPIERFMSGPAAIVQGYQPIRGQRFFVKIDPANLQAFQREHPDDPIADLLATPYWFRVHVYYDIVTSQGFRRAHARAGVWRTSPSSASTASRSSTVSPCAPSATGTSLANGETHRHPLRRRPCYSTMTESGAGFGAYATDRMLTEAGRTANTDDSYKLLGVEYDSRDYHAAVLLLRHHLPRGKIQMVMNSPDSLVTSPSTPRR